MLEISCTGSWIGIFDCMSLILMIIVFLHGEGTNRGIALVLDCQLSSTLHRDHSNYRSTLVLVAMQHLLPVPACIGQYTYLSINLSWY